MGSSTVRSSLRIVLSLIVLAVFVVGTQGPALATTKVGQSGAHGKYHVADTKVKPGARCRYDGAAGTWYLQRVHVRAPTIYGTSAKHRPWAIGCSCSVGPPMVGRRSNEVR